MVNQILVDYIRKYLSEGYTQENLFNYLIEQGYNSSDVQEALDIVLSNSKETDSHSIDITDYVDKNKGLIFVTIAFFLFFFIIFVVIFKFYILPDHFRNTEQLGSFSIEYGESLTNKEFLGLAFEDMANPTLLDSFKVKVDVVQNPSNDLDIHSYASYDIKNEKFHINTQKGKSLSSEVYIVDGVSYRKETGWARDDVIFLDLVLENLKSMIQFKFLDRTIKIVNNDNIIRSEIEEDYVNYYIFEFEIEPYNGQSQASEFIVKFNRDRMFVEKIDMEQYFILGPGSITELRTDIMFSDFNEKISINLPKEALNAV